jgi:hypothetical protein
MRKLVDQIGALMEATEHRAAVLAEASGAIRIGTSKGLLDFFWHPQAGEVEIGLGGEWWGGKFALGETVFHHRKEKVDDGYRPVKMLAKATEGGVVFTITGGFLSEPATVDVGVRKVMSEGVVVGEETYHRATKAGVEALKKAAKSLDLLLRQVGSDDDLNLARIDQIIELLTQARDTAEKHVSESSGGVRVSLVPGTLKQIETDMKTAQGLIAKAERYIQDDLKEALPDLAHQAKVDVALNGKFLGIEIELAIPEDPREPLPEGAFDTYVEQVKAWAKGAIPWRSEVTGKGRRILVTSQQLVLGR